MSTIDVLLIWFHESFLYKIGSVQEPFHPWSDCTDLDKQPGGCMAGSSRKWCIMVIQPIMRETRCHKPPIPNFWKVYTTHFWWWGWLREISSGTNLDEQGVTTPKSSAAVVGRDPSLIDEVQKELHQRPKVSAGMVFSWHSLGGESEASGMQKYCTTSKVTWTNTSFCFLS